MSTKPGAGQKERLTEHEKFAGFTDIEFNPSKSINCQARSCALFVALIKRELFDDAIQSPESFIETMKGGGRPPITKVNERRLAI